MSVSRDTSADEAEKLRNVVTFEPDRTLTGQQILQVRGAFDAAEAAFKAINVKGLPWHVRQRLQIALQSIKIAAPHVGPRKPSLEDQHSG